VAEVDDAIAAGVGAQTLETGVMRLDVVVLLSGWVRVGCARLVHGGLPSRLSGLRGILGGLPAGPFLYVQVLSHNRVAIANLLIYNA
jgi:hypothetical protein